MAEKAEKITRDQLAGILAEIGEKLRERKIKKEIRKAEEKVKLVEIEKEVAKEVAKEEEKPEKIERVAKIRFAEKGVALPKMKISLPTVRKEEEIDLTKINIYYPLIPRKGKPIYAYALIRWNPTKNALVYKVVEPELSKEDSETLKRIKSTLMERLDVDLGRLRRAEAKDYLSKKMEEVIEFMRIGMTEKKRLIMKYYLERDFIGLERIQPLLEDPNIEDISCVGVGVPIFVFHRDPKFASLETNIIFHDREELDKFVMKLAQRAGKSISVASPLVDASLPDGSRLQATLGTDIARRGSNFTIRKFTEFPLTPTDILDFGTADITILSYLWFCVERGKNILISGGTATGKTSFLNILSMFIRPEKKILTIEDTPELRLTHQYWMPEVAREPIATEEFGKIDMYSLLRESLRQRPDYIVVGEVRGKEAFVLFQQMTVGHPGLSTLHAEDMGKLVDRLTTEPIALPPTLLENLDVIVFLTKTTRKGTYIRRVKQIFEMVRWDPKENAPVVNEVFRWEPVTDTFKSIEGSIILKEIATERGVSEKEIIRDMHKRSDVLRWMFEKNIRDYRDVGKILRLFYADPKRLFAKIGAG